MKWIPIVLLFLLISAAQAKAGCVSITSPASGTSFIRGTNVLIKFSDTCSSRYFECLQIDGTNMVCSTPMPQQFNWATTTFSLGTHTVTIKSLDNGGAHLLGSASVPLTLVASTPTPKPTPSPTPKPTPSPTPKPTPSPTPVPASCISIVSPQPSQAIGGDFYFTTQDTCSGAWFESLFVDGLFVGDFSPNTIHWNTVAWVNGSHTVQVTSQSQNPGSRILGQTSESVEVKNVVLPTPTPTSKPTPSPTPGVTPTPKPSATPTPIAGCLHILSPADGSTVKLDFPLHTTDTCPSVQHEALVIDGAQVNEFIPNTEIVSSDDFPNGIHRVTIQAHLAEPPDMIVGSASVSYNFQNTFATPLPVPTSGPTPTAHFTTQPNSGPFADDSSTAPTDAQCEAVIPFKSETIVTNQAPHTDDLGMGISSAVNQTQARQSDLDRLAQFNYSFEQWSNYFWFKQITGKYTSTTWNIFRFSACKYGIDEDAIRAQATNENGSWSQWHAGGDRKTSLSLCQRQDVNLFGYICPSCCYQSWGDFQTKVFYEFMTWPMMEYSTDFSAEYRYAEQRACMNGDLTPYFSGRPEAGAYAADAAAYKNAPNSSSPHNFVNPVTGTLATNQDWMLFSCLSHHFSGSWNDSAANSYRTELLNHWKNHDWITPK